MSLSLRPSAARFCVLAVSTSIALFAVVALAWAYVTTDMNDWNLTTTTSTYGGGTQFHISTGADGQVSYRWLDAPNNGTVISSNSCSDGSVLGSTSIGVNDTTYHQTFWGTTGQCFIMRGRTTSGVLVNHDGRVQR